MLQHSGFGVQLAFASVDRGDGSDPRAAAQEVLVRLRVLAGLRDASKAWEDGQEAVLAIPVTDDSHVLTLSEQDGITSSLTTGDLKEEFRAQGLVLWLDAEVDAEVDADLAADGNAEHLADAEAVLADREPTDLETDDSIDPEMFAVRAVQVAVFSHRGPGVARILASLHRTTVSHRESGDWSLQQFETSESIGDWVMSQAELPVIKLNRTDHGAWFEVTTAEGGPVPFWTDAERDTVPVLDIGAIRVPETAEIYRRLLTEGDGSRDELVEVAAVVNLDVDAAHRALMPEALGGVAGMAPRQRAFLAAFGIALDLIDAATNVENAGAERHFLPVGPWASLREMTIAGFGELTPLTRRGRPIARIGDAIRRNPAAGLALALGEFSFGALLTWRSRGAGRFFGVLIVVDALIDAAIWVTRIRRGRRR